MRPSTAIFVGLLILTLVASTAQAGTVKTRFDTLTGDGSMQTNLGNGGGGVFEFTLLSENGDGVDLPTAVGSTFIGFCIELKETITYGAVRDYNKVALADAPNLNATYGNMGTNAAGDMALLFGGSFQGGSKTHWTPDQGAAFQLAVWEIVYENAQAAGKNFTGTYDVTDGDFKVTGGVTAAVLALANSYLTNPNSGVGPALRLAALSRPSGPVTGSGQDYVVVVPVPGAVWMGLGLIGLLAAGRARRRRR